MEAKIIIPTSYGKKAKESAKGMLKNLKGNDKQMKAYLLKHNMFLRSRRPYKTEYILEPPTIVWYLNAKQKWISKLYSRVSGMHLLTLQVMSTKMLNKRMDNKAEWERLKKTDVSLEIITP